MIRGSYQRIEETVTCPHTRGDDPGGTRYDLRAERLSPYAWG